MATFRIETDSGEVYRVEAPDENAAYEALFGAGEKDTGPDPARMGFASPQERERLSEMPVGEALGRNIGQGFMAGFGDEANALAAASNLPGAAAANAARTPVPNVLDVIAGGARVAAEAVAPGFFGDANTKKAGARLEEERAQDERSFRDQPVASIGGRLAGIVANPAGRVGLNIPANVAVGALYGAGEGEGLTGRAVGAAVGGGLGGAVSGALSGAGKLLSRGGGARRKIAEASERLGVAVPRGAASDSMAKQWAGQVATNIPVAGIPLRKAAQRTIEGAGQKLDETAAAMGGQSPEQAGELIERGLTGWINQRSAATVKKAYDAVDAHVNQSVVARLTATEREVADILARRANARIAGSSKAVDEVIAAVQDADGLNYQGIKDLRSYFGRLMKRPPDGMDGEELKQIYGALTRDLENVVRLAGNKKALSLWQRANTLNRLTAQRREAFAKALGVNANTPPAQVYDRLVAMARDGSRQNTKLLLSAKKAIGDDWEGAASAVVSRLGRSFKDGREAFSFDQFVTDWGKLSPNGKTILFGNNTAHRKVLDDIAIIAKRFKSLNKFANPSGTAQNILGPSIGAGLYFDPLSTAATVLPAGVLSIALARPVTAKLFRDYLNASLRRSMSSLQASARAFADRLAKEIGVSGEGWAEGLSGSLRPALGDQNGEGEGEADSEFGREMQRIRDRSQTLPRGTGPRGRSAPPLLGVRG